LKEFDAGIHFPYEPSPIIVFGILGTAISEKRENENSLATIGTEGNITADVNSVAIKLSQGILQGTKLCL
jgi:hypothetical protein